MKLQDYLEEKPANKKNVDAIFHSLIQAGITPKTMVDNLYNESSLKAEDWDELFTSVFMGSFVIDDVMEKITAFCQSRLLIGEEALLARTTVFGKVVSFDAFCMTFVKLKYYAGVKEAKAAVRHHIGLDLKLCDSKWASYKLGRFIMWSTFDLQGGSPFPDGKPASLIICSLGLDAINAPIILEYKLPASVIPKIPTCCDAYASPSWNKYFRRVENVKLYGETMPAESCPDELGRPEVVHEVITADFLISPVRYA